MSQLRLYSQFNLRKPYLVASDIDTLASHLASDGVCFEQWEVPDPGETATIAGMGDEDILGCFAQQISRLKSDRGIQHCEVTRISPPGLSGISIRDQYLSEHVHEEAECRLFLEGCALYYLHINQRIHIVQCNAGDFILIPPGIKHWFDMGPQPSYTCLRWFNSAEGQKNQYTGSYVAESTPRWEAIIGE